MAGFTWTEMTIIPFPQKKEVNMDHSLHTLTDSSLPTGTTRRDLVLLKYLFYLMLGTYENGKGK